MSVTPAENMHVNILDKNHSNAPIISMPDQSNVLNVTNHLDANLKVIRENMELFLENSGYSNALMSPKHIILTT